MKPRIWPIVLWAGLGIAVLIGLGMWQLSRLAEKQALLADIAQRTAAPPISLSDVLARRDKGADIEFVAVKTKGTFDHRSERHKLAAFEGSPGWEIITPFTSDEGIVVLVDRGLVSGELQDASKGPEAATPVEVTAVIRLHNNARGFFDPENDVDGNMWYWWDIPAMLSSITIPAEMKVAPFILQALPGDDPKKFPRAPKPEAQLSNNHLQYAITWFSLAIVLLVISGLVIRKQARRTDA
jgi:surfeit locus 1 family protein